MVISYPQVINFQHREVVAAIKTFILQSVTVPALVVARRVSVQIQREKGVLVQAQEVLLLTRTIQRLQAIEQATKSIELNQCPRLCLFIECLDRTICREWEASMEGMECCLPMSIRVKYLYLHLGTITIKGQECLTQATTTTISTWPVIATVCDNIQYKAFLL